MYLPGFVLNQLGSAFALKALGAGCSAPCCSEGLGGFLLPKEVHLAAVSSVRRKALLGSTTMAMRPGRAFVSPLGTTAVTRQCGAARGSCRPAPCDNVIAGCFHGCSELSSIWQGKSCPLSSDNYFLNLITHWAGWQYSKLTTPLALPYMSASAT